MQLIPTDAIADDAAELTEVAYAAKRYWDYPEEWIGLWSEELTIRPDYLAQHRVRVVRKDRILGWCATSRDAQETAWLEACWVRPTYAGRGIGRHLVEDAMQIAAGFGATTMRVISDPNARGFYEKLGFAQIGFEPSLPQGRRLPVLERAL